MADSTFRVFLCLTLTVVCPALTFADALSDKNPPAKGFNLAESDERAIEIADAVMEKMGGRENWDRTRYLTWKFFG